MTKNSIKKSPLEYKKRVIVTGGAGFIGSNYLNKFIPIHQDHFFVNIDCLTYAGNLDNLVIGSAQNYTFHNINICDKKNLEKIFDRYRPTGVINFAAESHVDMSIKNPDIFVKTNIIGTHNLLSMALAYKVERFHQISTDEVYGTLTIKQSSFTEKSPVLPRSPYSASKASGDCLVRAYHETFGLNTVITRCSNNYGPNQDISKLIPSFITKLLCGDKVPLYSHGEHIREWLYVGDCILAIDLVFHKGLDGEVYNIGGSSELTNQELTKKLLTLSGRDESFIKYTPDRKGHDFRYSLDCRKIKNELKWKAAVSLDEGLDIVFRWYKKQMERGFLRCKNNKI